MLEKKFIRKCSEGSLFTRMKGYFEKVLFLEVRDWCKRAWVIELKLLEFYRVNKNLGYLSRSQYFNYN